MHSSSYWIERLNLTSHPEGGYYRETYRSTETLESASLPARFTGTRQISTAIYFLLPSEHISHLHKIKSDEIWHFHTGAPLLIYALLTTGISIFKLGLDIDAGEIPQVVIPANCWFGARVANANAYTLTSCTVSPGFDFQDFEMATQNDLLESHPQHRDTILMLTKK